MKVDSDERLLVTGGAGCIGSHLCEPLLAEGHDIHCVDNLNSASKRNIAGFFCNPRIWQPRVELNEALQRTIEHFGTLLKSS